MLVTVRTEEAEPLCQTAGEVRAHVEHLTLGLRVSVVLSTYSSCRCSVIVYTPGYYYSILSRYSPLQEKWLSTMEE